MTLKDIIAIKGKGELFRVLSKSPKGIIVETLNEKRVKFKVQPNLQVLVLDDITIYPKDNNDIYLRDVFRKIYEKYKFNIGIDNNSTAEKIVEYFKELIPNYDDERVYLSDMKKMLKWYKIVADFYPQIIEELKDEVKEETPTESASPSPETETLVEPAVEEEKTESVKEKKPKAAPKKKTVKPEQKD